MKQERIGVRLTEELNNGLRDLAEKKGVSKNTLIVLALWNFLGKCEKSEEKK